MVVKAATKKKLMGIGVDEHHAHSLASNRKWADVKTLSPANILEIIFRPSNYSTLSTNITNPHPPLTKTYPAGVIQPHYSQINEQEKKWILKTNLYYGLIHNIKRKTIEDKTGIINHGQLFLIPHFYYSFGEMPSTTINIIIENEQTMPHNQNILLQRAIEYERKIASR